MLVVRRKGWVRHGPTSPISVVVLSIDRTAAAAGAAFSEKALGWLIVVSVSDVAAATIGLNSSKAVVPRKARGSGNLFES